MRFSLAPSARILLLLACAAPLVAQGVSSQLAGTVSKKGGGPLAGATILIRNQDTAATRTVTTDERGRYLAVGLPTGSYLVTVSKEGFQTAGNIKLTLTLGDGAPLNVQLPARAEAIVEVISTIGEVDTGRTTTAAFISPEALTSLPVALRSFTNLAMLTPTATPDTHNGNLSIAGQRGVNTSINIDGGDANEPFFGGALGSTSGAPFMISMESVKEFQVISGGASAEFGRMGGGYLNAITKSGSNTFEGTLWFYDFPKSLVALQPNLSGKPGGNAILDYKQTQFGFNVGGPIIADKLFFFVNYDGQRKTTPLNFQFGGNNAGTTVIDQTNPSNQVLLGYGGPYDYRQNLDTVNLKVDWNINADHTLSLNIKHNQFTSDYNTYNANNGYLDTFSNTEPDLTKNTTATLQWDWVLSPDWFNSFRINLAEDNLPRSTRSQIPQVSITNVGIYGACQYPRIFDDKRVQVIETLQYVTPNFQAKAGIDYSNLTMSETFSGGWQGVYTFQSLAAFDAGDWTSYTQRFAGPGSPGQNGWTSGAFAATEQQAALFLQTDTQVTPTFKVGLGLRYDRQVEPSFPILDLSNPMLATLPLTGQIPTDNSFSPRLNLTWNPESDRNLVVRASAGRYVSVTQGIYLDQVYASNGSRQESVQFNATDPNQDGIPYGANFNPTTPFSFSALPTSGSVAKPQVISFGPGFKNPRTNQVTLGADQGLGNWMFGVNFIYAKATNLERLDDLNLGTPTPNAAGREVFPKVRPNTSYGQILAYLSDAESIYHAYTLTAKYKAPDAPWTAEVYYTYAINRDDDSNERLYNTYYTQNPQKLQADWGPSDLDRRNVLTGMFTYQEKKLTGIEFGFALKYLSALPYSILDAGTDPANLSVLGQSGNQRLYVNGQDTGRNSQRACSNTQMDLKMARGWHLASKVKLTGSVEIFNILNRQDTYMKVSAKSTTDPLTPLIYTPGYVGMPRQVQLGLRLAF